MVGSEEKCRRVTTPDQADRHPIRPIRSDLMGLLFPHLHPSATLGTSTSGHQASFKLCSSSSVPQAARVFSSCISRISLSRLQRIQSHTFLQARSACKTPLNLDFVITPFIKSNHVGVATSRLRATQCAAEGAQFCGRFPIDQWNVKSHYALVSNSLPGCKQVYAIIKSLRTDQSRHPGATWCNERRTVCALS
jgi:hypothetical protein